MTNQLINLRKGLLLLAATLGILAYLAFDIDRMRKSTPQDEFFETDVQVIVSKAQADEMRRVSELCFKNGDTTAAKALLEASKQRYYSEIRTVFDHKALLSEK